MTAPMWTSEVDDGVAVFTFARPARNFMSFAGMEELEVLLRAIADRDDVGAVLLRSATPGFFIGHADVEDLMALSRGEPTSGDPGVWARTLDLIETMPQPVVAAVDGQAWGGGFELVLACTLCVASPAAHFSFPEVDLGIIPGAGGTARLPDLIGVRRTMELVLTSRVLDAAEAARLGVVQEVLPATDFDAAALAWARAIAHKPPWAVREAKQTVLSHRGRDLGERLKNEARAFLRCQSDPRAVAAEEAALARLAAAEDGEVVNYLGL